MAPAGLAGAHGCYITPYAANHLPPADAKSATALCADACATALCADASSSQLRVSNGPNVGSAAQDTSGEMCLSHLSVASTEPTQRNLRSSGVGGGGGRRCGGCGGGVSQQRNQQQSVDALVPPANLVASLGRRSRHPLGFKSSCHSFLDVLCRLKRALGRSPLGCYVHSFFSIQPNATTRGGVPPG